MDGVYMHDCPLVPSLQTSEKKEERKEGVWGEQASLRSLFSFRNRPLAPVLA